MSGDGLYVNVQLEFWRRLKEDGVAGSNGGASVLAVFGIDVDLYKPVFSDDVLFVIKRPLRAGVQSVLVVFANLPPIYFVDAVYPVEAADFKKIGPAERFFDSRYLSAVLIATSKTHSPITRKQSDALRRLKYVAEGGYRCFQDSRPGHRHLENPFLVAGLG